LSLGGHVRVGFENNLYLNDGTLATNNAALVQQVADGAKLIARPLCHAEQARALMGPGREGERKRREDIVQKGGSRHHQFTQEREELTTNKTLNNIGR